MFKDYFKLHIKFITEIKVIPLCVLLCLCFCKAVGQKQSNDLASSDMVFIHGGTFKMGSTEQDYDQPVHMVILSGFYLSKNEITASQFNDFVKATKYITDNEKHGDSSWIFRDKWMKEKGVNWRSGPEGHTYKNLEGNNFPVVHVSWNDAAAYCSWLSNKKGKKYRLPTEAEWEYAAGNGEIHSKFTWGNDLPQTSEKPENLKDEGSGWQNGFEKYSDGYKFLSPVGSFKKNSFGLYDMNGNVNEWCCDWYAYYTSETQTNPQGPLTGDSRAVRGGSFIQSPAISGIADHNDSPPNEGRGSIGFRIASGL